MKGGVTIFDIANYFLSFIISYNKIKESAYETIQSHFARSAGEEPNCPLPPTYFKLGQLYEINELIQGVAQGFVPGPLLFNIYLSNLF